MAGITGVPHVIPHRIHINGGDTGEIQLRVRGAAGQTVNILEVQNSAGTSLFTVDNDGDVSIAGNLDAVVNETLTGNIILSGNLTVNGNTTLGNAAGDTITITGTPTFQTAIALTTVLTSTSTATFSGFVSAANLTLPRRSSTPATLGSTGRVYTFAGDADTTELWYLDAAGNTVQITDAGALEGASLFWDDDEYIRMGNTAASPDVRMGWNTTQTVDAWYFGTADAQNVFLIAENGDRAFDFAHGAQTNPTLFGHSAVQSTTQWWGLTHNQTNALASAGAGAWLIDAPDGVQLQDSSVTGLSVITDGTTATWTAAASDNITIAPTTAGNLNLDAAGADFSVVMQNRTITAGAGHEAVIISPTWAAENFQHVGLQITATQNGANSSNLIGANIQLVKATAASVLAEMRGIEIGGSTLTAGTVTATTGLSIQDQSLAGSSESYAIRVASQTANATTTRAIEIAGSNVNNAIRFGSSGNLYSSGASNFVFTDVTNVGGLVMTTSTTNVTLNTLITGGAASVIFQQQTFTPGASHSGVQILPTWATENFNHVVLNLAGTQNGANSAALVGINLSMVKATGATTLDTMSAIDINAVSVTGTTTTSYGINIANQSPVGGTTAYGIRVQSQTANATTTRAIEVAGTGVNNAIRLGASANIYSNGAENIRFMDSTDGGGLGFTMTAAGNQAIFTTDTGNNAIVLQGQTFTPGAAHNAVTISPTWAAEDFVHRALAISPTQNGANTQAMTGITFTMTKATAATTLENMYATAYLTPVVTGTVTSSNVMFIQDQTNANITTPRGINFATAGVANSIVWGGSALQYANAAENIRFMDSTNVNGLDFNLLATAVQTINTVSATTGSIIFQNQTFTPAATHNAVQISPTWAAENFAHRTLYLTPTQNGANSQFITGIEIAPTKATGATTLGANSYIRLMTPTLAGTITDTNGLFIQNLSPVGGSTSYAIQIQNQAANATTTRAILIEGTGITNAIRLGSSPNIYSNGAENIRFMDSTDGGGLGFTMTAAGDQTINTTDTGNNGIVFQSQTFTAGATHSAVQITPTWAAENQQHVSTYISATQNGANNNYLVGLQLVMIKATAVTTLANMEAISINTPSVTGTITNAVGIRINNVSSSGGTTAYALLINSQTANATTTRAIEIEGTGVNNAIRLGGSPNIYSSVANTIIMMDSTNARGISFALTAAGNQQITSTAGNLVLMATSANVATTADVDFDMSAGGRLFGGGVQANSQTLAANTNLVMDENDSQVLVTLGSTSDNTITLPAASGNEGMIIHVYVTDGAGVNNAVVTAAGADTIANGSADTGNTTITLGDTADFVMLMCVNNAGTGDEWNIIAQSGVAVA